ncbi:MAG: hypothetical protein O3C28_21170 [Proteobacteria bacterium]|nr:hypothetical protein [Pseudomonadota bacterium]
MGKTIHNPNDVPEDATVFIALIPSIANSVARRLEHQTYSIILPPALN